MPLSAPASPFTSHVLHLVFFPLFMWVSSSVTSLFLFLSLSLFLFRSLSPSVSPSASIYPVFSFALRSFISPTYHFPHSLFRFLYISVFFSQHGLTPVPSFSSTDSFAFSFRYLVFFQAKNNVAKLLHIVIFINFTDRSSFPYF